MELPSRFDNYPKTRTSAVQEFIKDHPDLLSNLSEESRELFLKLCESVTQRRSPKSRSAFVRVLREMEAMEENPHRNLILEGAQSLSGRNLTVIIAYFQGVKALPSDEGFIREWIDLSLRLARRDIDVAVAFFGETPGALKTLDRDELLTWGRQALESLQSGREVWRAAKAYLKQAVARQCATPLNRWAFLLSHAGRIAGVSPAAAEAFIDLGNRACLLLGDEETERWVDAGLQACGSEEELVSYFSGTSLKSLEKRDGLISGVALKDKSHTLSLICEAYLGRRAKIGSNTSLIGVPGFTGGAATDGRTIYLPDKAPSFALYKLMALHQAMLILDHGSRGSEKEHGAKYLLTIHLEADRKLLHRMPGLQGEMKRLAGEEWPDSYPWMDEDELRRPMPWWGDYLWGLMDETRSIIGDLKHRAAQRADLPSETLEALLARMMADGERDPRQLWDRLRDILDNADLASPEAEDLEENVKTFLYKEWDEKLSDYKMDWCLVRQRFCKSDPNPFANEVLTRLHGIITLIRRQFMRLKPEQFKKYRAQPMGDELDIDALVQDLVDMRAGSFLSENIYIRRDKRIRDVAVLFLMDMSASTEERKRHGRRVIDIQKEAMLLMAEALDALGDPYALMGFSSEGRFRVDIFNIKDFGEPYGEEIRQRLGNLEPMELTRLGAVIRHGIYKLDNVPSAIKLMVILTDGRPYDLDYGGIGYAIADTKKAIQEARKHRIHPFIITSDKKGASYLKEISPQTQSVVLRRIEHLPTLLPAIYKRLTG